MAAPSFVQPHQPQGSPMDVLTQQGQQAPGPPVAGPGVPVAGHDPPGRSHQEREGEIRGGFGKDFRGMADDDASPGGLGDVDVVHPHRGVADDFEPRAWSSKAASILSVSIVSKPSTPATLSNKTSRGGGSSSGQTSASQTGWIISRAAAGSCRVIKTLDFIVPSRLSSG